MNNLTYEPIIGESIKTAARNACYQALQNKVKVNFKFNDINLVAEPDDNYHDLVEEYQNQCDTARINYENSEEYKQEQKLRTAEIKDKQLNIDLCLKYLPGDIKTAQNGDFNMLMDNLRDYSKNVDDIGIDTRFKEVLELFSAAHFEENKHVGQKPEYFNTKKRMAEYIIGQSINCMKKGLGPHPSIISKFVGDYFKMKE